MSDKAQDIHDLETEYSRKELLRIAGGTGLSVALGSSFLAPIATGASRRTADKPIALRSAPKKPFDPRLKPGLKPNLPRRIGCSLPAGGELWTGIDRAVRQAAKSRGIEYISAQANGNSSEQFQQTQQILSRGVGALLVFDLAPPALVPLQLKAIKQGTAVICGPFAVSTNQMTADQYKLGHAAGSAAVKWIKEHLGGKAEVALFNLDQAPSQRPKSRGVRDALKQGGQRIKLVSDVTVKTQAPDESFRLTNTILQRHPNVNVWIGSDGPLGGTLSALQASGKAGKTSALFGYGDGDAQALDAIIKGGPYKSTQGFSYPLVAHAWVKYASDWLAGKSIPLVLSLEPIALNSKASIDAFKRLNASPARAYANNPKKYITPLGNTSYGHHRYLKIVA